MSMLVTRDGQAVTLGGSILAERSFTREVVDLTPYAKQAQTTGQISAGSPELEVEDPSGFSIGDHLIVEIGGEAGAGALGTMGVGGSWPSLNYADAAAMNADTSKPNGRLAWLVSTGNVYQYATLGSVWTQVTNYWYAEKASPKALQAQVLNKVGNVLTLDTNASADAVGANVYFNNVNAINAVIVAQGAAKNYKLPLGLYFGGAGALLLSQKNSAAVSGYSKNQTRLINPRGAGSLSVEAFQSHGSEFYDFAVEGNARLTGYGFDRRYESDVLPLQTQPALLASLSNRHLAHDLKITDVWYNALRGCTNSDLEDLEIISTEGQGAYVQWQADIADGSFNCWGRRITVTSPYLIGGFEVFSSTDCGFEDCAGTNAARAWNSATNATFRNHTTIVTPMSQNPVGNNWSDNNPMFSINNNIAPGVGGGGQIIDDTTVIQGFINADDVVPTGIAGVATARGVTISGGSYTAPDYVDPNHRPVAIDSDADDWLVEDFTAVGVVPSFSANIDLTPGGTSEIRNSTAAIMRASVNGGGNTYTTFKTV